MKYTFLRLKRIRTHTGNRIEYKSKNFIIKFNFGELNMRGVYTHSDSLSRFGIQLYKLYWINIL